MEFVSIPAFINPINDGLFAITFFYARIYLYFKYIITNQALFKNISKYNKFYMCDKIIITIVFGLFILNLYWFGLILGGVIKLLDIDTMVKRQLESTSDAAFLKKIEEIRSTITSTPLRGFKKAHHQ